ncbi:12322_t:CDS:2, partial [Funneliformis caledonium]
DRLFSGEYMVVPLDVLGRTVVKLHHDEESQAVWSMMSITKKTRPDCLIEK